MDNLEIAILRTVLYADIFDFPLTAAEIHHFLIHDEAISLEQIEQILAQSTELDNRLATDQHYYALASRGDVIARRHAKADVTQTLWDNALHYGRWLARLPFVRMVGLTGALAVKNPTDEKDDLDYLIVTAPGRVWLARAFSVMLVRLMRLRGVVLCPNYVVAETALEQPNRDLFLAHEVTQLIPLYGLELYAKFRTVNQWVLDQLPNAERPFYQPDEYRLHPAWKQTKHLLEWLLSSKLGDWLEDWEYRRKLKRFAPDMTTPHSSARLDTTQVKGHFNDHGHPVLRKYHERLIDHNLTPEPHLSAGD